MPPKPGIVVLHVEIGADSVPGKIRVIQGLGTERDRQAIESVEKWRFEPGVSAARRCWLQLSETGHGVAGSSLDSRAAWVRR